MQHAALRLARRGLATAAALAAIACRQPPTGPHPVIPQAEYARVETTLFLVGDAGEPAPGGEPVLRALDRLIGDAGPRSVVAFLGDNVYPHGLPDSGAPDRAEAERRLNAQIDLIRHRQATGVFIPGNHDWGNREDGWESVRRQGRYVRNRGEGFASFLPFDGCPGPEVWDIGTRTRVVVLDTEWWLFGRRPAPAGSACATVRDSQVVDSLRRVLAGAGDRQVILLAHHPLVSGGAHGGHFAIKDYVFPLRHLYPWLWIPVPVVYPLSRRFGILDEDLSSPAYRYMKFRLESVLSEHQPLVWASGHDHNLQLLEGGGARFWLVSGGGIYGRSNPVTWRAETRFAEAASGFMRLDILADGGVRLGILTVDSTGAATERYSRWLHEQ